MEKESTLLATFKVMIPYIIAVFIGLMFSFILRNTIKPYIVSGNSMYPTFKSGNVVRVIDDFDDSDLYSGQIIVFVHDGKNYVKRIVAVPGHSLYIEDGILYVNDLPGINYEEKISDSGILNKSINLADDEFFCIGDNRNASLDCRVFGPVKRTEIIAIVGDKIF